MPSVNIARAVLIACSAASRASMVPKLPFIICSVILKVSSSRDIFSAKSRMLSATPRGPTSPSTKAAKSVATSGSGTRAGSNPFSLAFFATAYMLSRFFSREAAYCLYSSLIGIVTIVLLT